MKTQTTYEAVFIFRSAAQAWLAGRDKGNQETKLGYAIQRVMPRVDKITRNYDHLAEDINIDNCVVDDKGVIVREAGQYRFTKEGMKARNKACHDLLEKPVEIEPYFATDIPKDLSEATRLAFLGFVIEAAPEA